MEFLKEYGLTDTDINEIVERNNPAVIKNVILNKENVKKVIKYLLDVGINNGVIKELFLEQIGMFHRTKDEIEDVFNEYELDSIIKSLNYDVNTVDLIEFN